MSKPAPKVTHTISWEVQTAERPGKRGWLSRLSKMVPTKVHVYTMEVTVGCSEGDSTDSQFESILGQLKALALRKEHSVKASNGVVLTKFVHEDLLE